MGAHIAWQGDRVAVTAPRGLCGIEADGGQCPDIMPILALTCALARGESRLKNLSRLRIKECDRLEATCRMLAALGAKIRVEDEGLIIQGVERLSGGVGLDSFNDHRMAMLAAIASTRCEKPIELTNPLSVQKSWPAFWEEFGHLKASQR